jgi:hypothetical protein
VQRRQEERTYGSGNLGGRFRERVQKISMRVGDREPSHRLKARVHKPDQTEYPGQQAQGLALRVIELIVVHREVRRERCVLLRAVAAQKNPLAQRRRTPPLRGDSWDGSG